MKAGCTFTATAPTRIDLAGGWTDVPPVACDGADVIAFAISLRTRAEIYRSESGCIHGTYSSVLAAGSGLGTSGAMNVALMAAIDGGKSSKESIAERAFQFETIAGNVGGRQDQYMAALGGFRHLKFVDNHVLHESLDISESFKEWLSTNLLLFDSQIIHTSGLIHESIWQRYATGDPGVKAGIQQLRDASHRMVRAITLEDRAAVSDALRLVCSGVDLLDPRIHEPFKHVMLPLIAAEEVYGWKAVGAGAGGCLIVLSKEDCRAHVLEHCHQFGWKHIQWSFEQEGVQTTVREQL